MAAAGGRCSASSIDCLAGGIGWVGEGGVVGTVVREPELAMAIDSAGAGGGASGGFFSGVKEAASNDGGGKEVRAGGVADCLGCCCCCLPRPGWEEGGYNDLRWCQGATPRYRMRGLHTMVVNSERMVNNELLDIPSWTPRRRATCMATALFGPGRTPPCVWWWSCLALR